MPRKEAMPTRGQVVAYEGVEYFVLRPKRVWIAVVSTDFSSAKELRKGDHLTVREPTAGEQEAFQARLEGPPIGSEILFGRRTWTVYATREEYLLVQAGLHLDEVSRFAEFRIRRVADPATSSRVREQTRMPGNGALIRLLAEDTLFRVVETASAVELISTGSTAFELPREEPLPAHRVIEEREEAVAAPRAPKPAKDDLLEVDWHGVGYELRPRNLVGDLDSVLRLDPDLWPVPERFRFHYVKVPAEATQFPKLPQIVYDGPHIRVWVPGVPYALSSPLPELGWSTLAQIEGLAEFLRQRCEGEVDTLAVRFYFVARLLERKASSAVSFATSLQWGLEGEDDGSYRALAGRVAREMGHTAEGVRRSARAEEARALLHNTVADTLRQRLSPQPLNPCPLALSCEDEIQRLVFEGGTQGRKEHLQQVLRGPDATPEQLADACAYKDLIETVLQRHDIPPEAWEVAARHGRFEAWSQVDGPGRRVLLRALLKRTRHSGGDVPFLRKTQLPVDLLGDVIERGAEKHVWAVLDKEALTEAMAFVALERYPAGPTFRDLARRPAPSRALAERLLELAGDDRDITWELARSSEDGAVLRKIANIIERDSWEARTIADNPHTPADVLMELSKSRTPVVKRAVAQNPATPENVLRRLSRLKGEAGQIARRRLCEEDPDS